MPGSDVRARRAALPVAIASAVLAAVVSVALRPAFAFPGTYSAYLVANNTPLSSGHTTVTLTYHAIQSGGSCEPGVPPTGSPVRFRMDGNTFSDGTLLNDACQGAAAITLTQAQACQGQTFTAAL